MASPATSPVMVGRDRDLADLREAHLTTLSGAPHGVVVAGEAGIGKTRLLTEFLDGLDGAAVVARGQCVSMGTLGSPFAPVRGVIRDLVEHFGAAAVLESAGPAGHLLAALLPELAPLGVTDTEVAQEQLHDIISQLLVRLSEQAPLVVLVEDLHWADVATLDLVRALMTTLRDCRVSVVLSYRTDDVGRGHPLRPVLVELDRSRDVTRVELRRLTAVEAAQLASLIRGEAPDPEQLALLVERSEGVPFFVEELLGLDSLDGRSLPDTLRELVLARYVRLSEPTQAVLRLLAAGGVSVEHELVELVYEDDRVHFDTAVREAIAAQLLTADGTSYTFRHALTQEAVHDELLPGERARFHARYAAALERRPDLASSTAEIAQHWLDAHDLPRAFTATVAASQEALATGAPASAGRLGERALELWTQVPDAAVLAGCEKADLFLATAQAYDESGDGRALAILEEALAECPREDGRRYALLLHEAMVVRHANSRPGGLTLVEEALALVPKDGDDENDVVRLRVHVGLGIARLISRAGAQDTAQILEEAVDAGRTLLAGNPTRAIATTARFELARGLSNLATARVDQGDIDAAFAALDEALDIHGEDPNTRLRDAERRAGLLVRMGAYREALEVATAGHALARQVGQERGWGLSSAIGGVSALLALGRHPEAEALLDRVRNSRPWGFVAAYEVSLRAELLVALDEVEMAEEVLRGARSVLDATAAMDGEDSITFAISRATVALARGDLAAAWSRVRHTWREQRPAAGPVDQLLVIAARVLAGLRGTGTAPDDMSDNAAERWIRETFDALPAWDVVAVWRTLRDAELSGDEGTGTDVEAWRAAAEASAGGRVPVSAHAHALLRLAEAEIAAGDRHAATATLGRARELCSSAGLRRAGRLRDELAARAGLGPAQHGPAAGTPLQLTAREQQVLGLVTRGLTNRQIGERLFISDKTASVHVSAILRKLGASSRTEAAVRAAELGLPTRGAEPSR